VLTGPPAVWQTSVYTLLPEIVPLLVWRGVPAEPTLPLPSAVAEAETLGPLSVQLCTLVANQLSVEEFPLRTRDGDAESDIVGLTTVAVTLAWPPFEHWTVYVWLVAGVRLAEPLAPVELLKLFELEVLPPAQLQVTVTLVPDVTVTLDAGDPPGF
jgi:hypothetical protein